MQGWGIPSRDAMPQSQRFKKWCAFKGWELKRASAPMPADFFTGLFDNSQGKYSKVTSIGWNVQRQTLLSALHNTKTHQWREPTSWNFKHSCSWWRRVKQILDKSAMLEWCKVTCKPLIAPEGCLPHSRDTFTSCHRHMQCPHGSACGTSWDTYNLVYFLRCNGTCTYIAKGWMIRLVLEIFSLLWGEERERDTQGGEFEEGRRKRNKNQNKATKKRETPLVLPALKNVHQLDQHAAFF